MSTEEKTEVPHQLPQIKASHTSSRSTAAIVAFVAIAATLAFAMVLFGSACSGSTPTNETNNSSSASGEVDAAVQEADAKRESHGGDAGSPWAQSGVQRPSDDQNLLSGVGGIVGTWVCRDYDFDGKTYSFQATFSDTGTFAVWLYDVEADEEARYAGLRSYHAEGDQVVEDGGFVFSIESADTITLHVSEENQAHQEKSSYSFTRKTNEAETLKQLSWTSGDWYAQDKTGEKYYFGMNGYWYKGDEDTSSGCWYILDNDVILEGDPAAGTTTTTLTFSSANYDTLENVDNERTYGWEPPGQE